MTWIEIFAGGPQTDSQGRPHDGDALIEQALAAFSAEDHQPPVVLGHPQNNDPAFGWVTGLRKSHRAGRTVLEARMAQIAPELKELVRLGRFQTRSASFYPNGSLRHVGFLGAVPPAVKGLAPVRFSGSPQEALSFNLPPGMIPKFKEDGTTMWDDIKQFLGFAKEVGWGPVQNDPTINPSPKPLNFSEDQLEKAKNEAATRAKAEAESEFAEKTQALVRQHRAEAIKARVDKGVVEGLIPPAFVDGGLVEFLISIDGAGPVDFGETRIEPVDKFLDFMAQAKSLNLWSEIATRDHRSSGFPEDQTEARLAEAIALAVQPRTERNQGGA